VETFCHGGKKLWFDFFGTLGEKEHTNRFQATARSICCFAHKLRMQALLIACFALAIAIASVQGMLFLSVRLR
jgi:hypothetical protein